MTDTPRLKIKEYRYLNVHIGDFEGSIDNAIEYLESLKGEGWTGLEEDFNYENRDPILRAYVERPETDLEFKERVKNEEMRKASMREMRLQQYEELRKEFGPHD